MSAKIEPVVLPKARPAPDGSRRSQRGDPGTIDEERGYDMIEVLDEIAQAALNRVLRKQGVTSVLIGAHRGAAQGQPRGGELGAGRRGGAAAGRGQRDAADLPVLASAAVQF